MCQQSKPTEKYLTNEELYKRLSVKNQQLSEFILQYMQKDAEGPRPSAREINQKSIKALIRIVGGVPALPGEFNECCLIGTRNINGTIKWFCTGVLIHERVVITAAHCIDNGGAYVIALSCNNFNDLSSAEIINTRKALVHSKYSPATEINDIAVLVLHTPAKTPSVPLASSQQIVTAGEVELVGFGNDDILSTKGFGIKRKVEVDMICVRQNVDEDLNQREAVFGFESDLEFVAGGKGFDTCNGDSGGPVYVGSGGNRMVAGLTSRATKNSVNPCGDGGIYTRVDIHSTFINSIISNI